MKDKEPNDYDQEQWEQLTSPARPERDPDADYDQAVYDEWLEGGQIHSYEGSLIDDCRSIYQLGEDLKAKMAEPIPENLFDKARRLNAEAADLAKADLELKQLPRPINN